KKLDTANVDLALGPPVSDLQTNIYRKRPSPIKKHAIVSRYVNLSPTGTRGWLKFFDLWSTCLTSWRSDSELLQATEAQQNHCSQYKQQNHAPHQDCRAGSTSAFIC